MPERHHWQCSFNWDEYAHECTCGVSGPRSWDMDLLPHDRAPNDAEVTAWLVAVAAHEEELGAANEPEEIAPNGSDASVLESLQAPEEISADRGSDA